MKNMRKLIVPVLLMLSIFAGFALSQTKRRPAPRRTKTTIVKRIVTPKRIVTTKSVVLKNSPAVTTPSGLTYIVTQPGTGAQLKAGDMVTVHYTGLLTSGVKFDSSHDRNDPISFPLGAGKVIKGWDEGLQKLRVGDRATLFIPPSIGYGSRGSGRAVPPDATLIFIIEVVGVQ
ncbi:MAG: FKBP-type peptidyl-prolyl cis-trans isomerase [Acidobacteriota bacterium]|nr:FKBP-type peptidyl-prolyl cis-trans isomerase [Acidobacteriota bacterium]